MVKINLLLLIVIISGSIYAQIDTLEDYSIMIVDEAPCFKVDENGLKNIIYSENKLKEFIQNNIRYPESAKSDSVYGRVFVSFWIDTIGNTIDHKVIKGIRDDLDNEALRVTKLIVFEKPAMQKGKPVKISFTVPVEFKLVEPKEETKKRCKK